MYFEVIGPRSGIIWLVAHGHCGEVHIEDDDGVYYCGRWWVGHVLGFTMPTDKTHVPGTWDMIVYPRVRWYWERLYGSDKNNCTQANLDSKNSYERMPEFRNTYEQSDQRLQLPSHLLSTVEKLRAELELVRILKNSPGLGDWSVTEALNHRLPVALSVCTVHDMTKAIRRRESQVKIALLELLQNAPNGAPLEIIARFHQKYGPIPEVSFDPLWFLEERFRSLSLCPDSPRIRRREEGSAEKWLEQGVATLVLERCLAQDQLLDQSNSQVIREPRPWVIKHYRRMVTKALEMCLVHGRRSDESNQNVSEDEVANQNLDAVQVATNTTLSDDTLDRSAELVQQLAEIADRDHRHAFPVVPAHCQVAVDHALAEELCQWALSMDYVQFQSFLEWLYADYRRAHQLPEGENLAVARLNYMRDVYYLKLREWRDAGADLVSIVDDIKEALMFSELEPREQSKIEVLICGLWPDRLQPFLCCVDDLWRKAYRDLPAFIKFSEERFRQEQRLAWVRSTFLARGT